MLKKTASKKVVTKPEVSKKSPASKSSVSKPSASKTEIKIKCVLTEKQLNYFRDLLTTAKSKILQDITEIEDQNLNSHRDSSGDLSGYSLHMADVGTDNFDRELALNVVGNEHDVLYQIDKALERMEHGAYGICEMMQVPIPITRLEAIPWTPYCKEAAEKIEKGR